MFLLLVRLHKNDLFEATPINYTNLANVSIKWNVATQNRSFSRTNPSIKKLEKVKLEMLWCTIKI